MEAQKKAPEGQVPGPEKKSVRRTDVDVSITSSNSKSQYVFDPARAEAISEELTSLNQWVCHDSQKIPCNPRTGKPASSTDPQTWSDFETAIDALDKWPNLSGIGFVFSEHDGLVGVDLDKASNGNGLPAAWAAEHINAFQTYVEVSPSGNGYHIIGKAKLPDGQGRKKDNIEIYDRGRYFTVTGRVINANPVEDCQQAVDNLLRDHFGASSKTIVEPEGWKNVSIVFNPSRNLSALLAKKADALKEADSKFKQSVERTRKDLQDGSPSAYDMSIASLAVRAGWSDQEIADFLIHNRQRHGDDLKRKDYYQRTVFRARADHDRQQAVDDLRCVDGPGDAVAQIKKVTNLNIKRIVQVGQRSSQWFIEFEDGEKQILGSTAQVMTLKTWGELMFEMGAGILKIAKKDFDSFRVAIQTAREIVQDESMQDHEWIRDWLNDYLESGAGKPGDLTSEDAGEMIRQKRPVYESLGNGEKGLCIHPKSLGRYILTSGERTNFSKIKLCLAALGFRANHKVQKWCPEDKKSYTAKYWILDKTRLLDQIDLL